MRNKGSGTLRKIGQNNAYELKKKKMKDWKNKCLNAIGRIQVELYAEAYGGKTDIWKLYVVARQYYTEH